MRWLAAGPAPRDRTAYSSMRFRDRLTTASKLKYLGWRALPWRQSVSVRLATGGRVILNSSAKLELGVAYEIFVADFYRPSREIGPVRTIVDVGANVGYSVVYWSRTYPQAQIEAIEPHPRHARLLRRVVSLNGLSDRVNVYEVAAGTIDATALLTDDGVCSTLAPAHTEAGFRVPVVDFFSIWGKMPIDLLKLDCEGGEHDIVMDPRFADLRVGTIVLEWHRTAARPFAAEEITSRLSALGWQLEIGREVSPAKAGSLQAVGMVWGFARRARRVDGVSSR